MPVPQPASPARVTKRLEYLDAMLPRRAQDEEGGEKRTAGYLSLLLGQTDDALAFMVREACRRHDWFPTAKQLLGILAEYRPPQPEQAFALLECERFAAQAFDRWMDNLRDGQPAGDVPEQWMRIAVERGLMRRLEDGSFVSRALYHGPFKAYSPPPRAAGAPFIHLPPIARPDTVEQAEAA
ncbi:MAG: hypothetical protein INR68_17530 [Methylobacterium mesophilicum]|nr:hypothetical protein [Methylobacterium mesophilicum]